MPDSLISVPHWIFNNQSVPLLDRVHIQKPGESGDGEYRVQGSEPFLRGHFPGAPLVPGVILVEIVSQLACLVAESAPYSKSAGQLRLSSLRIVKIFDTARPKEVIHVLASITARSRGLVHAQGRVAASGRDLLTVEMTFCEVRDCP
jgi:3-hydroxyacyl-[acyl-carrier-protein] dehydratase